MPQVLHDNRLNRLVTAPNKQIKLLERRCVSPERLWTNVISQLISDAAANRWRFAYEHRHNANKLLKSKPPLYRSAISRFYYSMYHAIRACVFVSHQGDDYERHSDLLKYNKLSGFPSNLNWQNILKDARELRNRADYDPYPKSNIAWKQDALDLKKDADLFLSTTRTYLRKKGRIL